jgi:hypothetical protein
LLAVVHALRVFRHYLLGSGAPRPTTRPSRGSVRRATSIASWRAGLTRLRSSDSTWSTCRAG